MTRELDGLGFNRAVARLYELVNALAALGDGDEDKMPRLWVGAINEIAVADDAAFGRNRLGELGGDGLVANAWPEADMSVLVRDEVVLPVQFNGKKRGEISVPKSAEAAIIKDMALSDAGVEKFIDGREIQKIIIVPGRIVNLVVK